MPEISIVVPPFSLFFDSNGIPLEFGKIYIGTAGLEPRSNPIAIYSDEAFLVPVTQPVRTALGYPVDGSNALISIYIGVTSFSITVLNKNDELVYSNLTATPAILAQQATLEAYVDDYLAAALPGQQATLETYIDAEVAASLPGQQETLEAYVDTELTAALPAQETSLQAYIDAEIATALANQCLHVRDERSAGLNGDVVVGGSWEQLTLNTLRLNSIPGASLASDQVTLDAGTYQVRLSVPVYGVKESFKIRLYNVTDASSIDVGYPVYTPRDGDADHDGQMRSELHTTFTLAATKILQAQVYVSSGATVGRSFNTGDAEVYTDLQIKKLPS